jgi:hypothetical protein
LRSLAPAAGINGCQRTGKTTQFANGSGILIIMHLQRLPFPDEVGQSIAGFVAQVAVDENRKAAMRDVIQAGPLGSSIPFV